MGSATIGAHFEPRPSSIARCAVVVVGCAQVVLDANFLHVNDLSFSLVSEPWGLLERCDNQRVRSSNDKGGLAPTRRSNAHGDFLCVC